MNPLTDDDLFPFGVHKGKPMWKVPGRYYDWLIDQPWLPEKWPAIEDYILRNRAVIDKELKEAGIIE